MDKKSVEAIARTVHEALRGWIAAHGEKPPPVWQRAPAWMRESSRESVRFALENPDAADSHQHDQWMAQKKRDGWSFAPLRNNDKKHHPMMVPYEDLPDFEKRKDTIVRALTAALSQKPD